MTQAQPTPCCSPLRLVRGVAGVLLLLPPCSLLRPVLGVAVAGVPLLLRGSV